MTEEVKVEEAPEKDESNNANIERALRWVCEQSEDKQTCPLCGWRPAFENKNKPDVLFGHVRQRHLYASIEAHLRGNLDGDRRPPGEVNVLEEAGLEVVDSDEEFSLLRVPQSIKVRYERDGWSLRWVTPERLQMFKDRGWQFAEAKPGEMVEARDASSEDQRIRAAEMTLMCEPPRLHKARVERREKRAKRDFMAASKEDFDKRMEGHAGRAYDAALRSGWDKGQARALASAIERGVNEGSITVKR